MEYLVDHNDTFEQVYLIVPGVYGNVMTDYIGYTTNRMLYLKYIELLTAVAFSEYHDRISILQNDKFYNVSLSDLSFKFHNKDYNITQMNKLIAVKDNESDNMVVMNICTKNSIDNILTQGSHINSTVRTLATVSNPFLCDYINDTGILLKIKERIGQYYIDANLLKDEYTDKYDSFKTLMFKKQPFDKEPIIWQILNKYIVYDALMFDGLILPFY